MNARMGRAALLGERAAYHPADVRAAGSLP